MKGEFALSALLLLAGCGGSEPKPVAEAPPPPPCESASFEGSPLTHCIADPARHRIRTVLGPEGGPPYRSLSQLALGLGNEGPDVAFAMNGGMFDAEGQPIGYYVEDGERRHTLNRNEGSGNFHLLPNGVFYGSDDRWAVRTSEDFAAKVSKRPKFGTQSGPMLVIAGELHPKFDEDGESRKIRNGVGVDGKGRAHFVISDAPISFGKFARYFRDRLKTPNALFLDGSVSSLWDPHVGRVDGGPPLGPLIVVENRAKAPKAKGAE
ncbi:phosphodiester glycosidase family protein [Novosphingobium aquimarinum]|uniref:phosphodiester glycosidase family protein n=1 Tax=Novosphingobium aquimarinum TaxID=2682494 RepID=UPI0012EC3DA4|nr:phosphodiester glycosidase family protein [Novosphingobium aquimarinum]